MGHIYLLKCTLTNIDIHSGSRNGQHYDEDIVFERETGGRRALDGVRRSERREEEEVRELAIIDTRDKGRRFEAEKSKKDRMWTEITKDLVSEEAIKEVGYEFEDTDEFYYVMEYLRYVSICLLLPHSTFQAALLTMATDTGGCPPPCRTYRRHQTGSPRTYP